MAVEGLSLKKRFVLVNTVWSTRTAHSIWTVQSRRPDETSNLKEMMKEEPRERWKRERLNGRA